MGERLRFCTAVEPRGRIVASPYGADSKRGQKDWEGRQAHCGCLREARWNRFRPMWEAYRPRSTQRCANVADFISAHHGGTLC